MVRGVLKQSPAGENIFTRKPEWILKIIGVLPVKIALDFKPDWIVLDLLMPHVLGTDIFNELNKLADFEFSAVFYSSCHKHHPVRPIP